MNVTCTCHARPSELRPCLDGRMVRRRYSSMGVFYGVVQQYDYFGGGTGATSSTSTTATQPTCRPMRSTPACSLGMISWPTASGGSILTQRPAGRAWHHRYRYRLRLSAGPSDPIRLNRSLLMGCNFQRMDTLAPRKPAPAKANVVIQGTRPPPYMH